METISDSNPSNSLLIVEDDRESKDLLVTIIGKKFPGLTIHFCNQRNNPPRQYQKNISL